MRKVSDFLHWHLCRLILRIVSRNSLRLERGPMGSWKISVRGISQKSASIDLQDRGIASGGVARDSPTQFQRERIPGDVYRESFGVHPGA